MPRRNRTEREALFQQKVDLAQRRATRPATDQETTHDQPVTQEGGPAAPSPVVSDGVPGAARSVHGTRDDASAAPRDATGADARPAATQREASEPNLHDMNRLPGCGTLSVDARRQLENPHARRLEGIVWHTKFRSPGRRYVRMSELRHSPDQVREDYGGEEFEHLERTADRYGILKPIQVRPASVHEPRAPYVLLDGHRRLRIFEDLVLRACEWDEAHGASVPYDPEVPVEITHSLSAGDAAEITFNANETALAPTALERGRGISKIAAHLVLESGEEPTVEELAAVTGKSTGTVHKHRSVALRVRPIDLELAFAACNAGSLTAPEQAPTPRSSAVPRAVRRALSIDDLYQASKRRDTDEAWFRARLVKAMEKAISRAAAKEVATGPAPRRAAPDVAGASAPKPKRGTGPVDMQAIYQEVVDEGGFTGFRLSKKVGQYDAAQARRWIQTGAPAIVALAERVGEPAVVVQDAGPGSVIVVQKQPSQATAEEVRAAAKALTDELRRHLDRARALGAEDVLEVANRALGLDDEPARGAAA